MLRYGTLTLPVMKMNKDVLVYDQDYLTQSLGSEDPLCPFWSHSWESKLTQFPSIHGGPHLGQRIPQLQQTSCIYTASSTLRQLETTAPKACNPSVQCHLFPFGMFNTLQHNAKLQKRNFRRQSATETLQKCPLCFPNTDWRQNF